MKIRGCFVSDLHLLSSRSVGARLWQDFRGELLRCNLLVLGGDIFDFRWSRHEELSHSLSEVSNWLDALLKHYPQLRVAYVLGNHDCLLSSRVQASTSFFGFALTCTTMEQTSLFAFYR